jgi:hypothetical protein
MEMGLLISFSFFLNFFLVMAWHGMAGLAPFFLAHDSLTDK